jgi:hypothetical protein
MQIDPVWRHMHNARALEERGSIDRNASYTSNLFRVDFRRERKYSGLSAFRAEQ